MADNPFDQFDAQATQGPNPFDQFDEAGNLRLAGLAQGGRAIRPHSNMEKLITGEPVQGETEPTLGGTLAAAGSGVVQGLGQLNWLERYPEYLIRQGLSHLGVQDRLAAAQGNSGEGVMTAGFHDPQNTTERIANVAGNVVGGLPIYAATEGLTAPVVLGGTIAASETGAKGGSAGDIATSGAIGGTLPALGYGFGKAISKITPHPSSAIQQANADTLKAAGIDLTAGQETGSKALRRKELVLGQKIDINPEEIPQQQLGQIGMRSTGAPPDELAMNSGNIKNAVDRIGYVYDSVTGRNNLAVDKQLANEATNIGAGYYGPPGGQPNVLGNLSQDVNNVIGYIGQPGRVIAGPEYNTLRSQLSDAAHTAFVNGQNRTGQALRDLTNSLDDAFERSVQAGPHSGDAGALRDARRQYQNLLIMQKASSTGSEAAENEMLTPGALKNAAKSVYGERKYATGQGELTPISRAANAVLKPMSSSGTAENTEALRDKLKDYTLAALIGGSAGAGSEYTKDKDVGWQWPLIGALAGVAGQSGVTSARAHLLYSPLMQSILRNRLLSPEAASLVKALGAGGGAGVTPAVQPSAQALVNVLTGTGGTGSK